MREIKFRAWDKANKHMHSLAALHFTRGEVMYYFGPPQLGGAVVKQKDCELMQYTGLKDKNGVEIYEGDIVRWTSWRNASKESDYKTEEVVFDESMWRTEKSIFSIGIYSDIEVIGNIHENKELLK